MKERPHLKNAERLGIPVVAYLLLEFMHYNNVHLNYYKPSVKIKYLGLNEKLYKTTLMNVLFKKEYIRVKKDGDKGDLEISPKVQKRISNYVGSRSDYEQFFELFWSEYPTKVSKVQAKKAFFKLPMNDHSNIIQDILDGIEKRKAFEKNASKEVFIPSWPNPSTYLNNERWKDEYEVQGGKDLVYKEYKKEQL